MATQTTRANSTIKELLAERDEKEKRIEELAVIAERVRAENDNLKKAMEEKVREKAVQITKLEQALELKFNELTAAVDKKDSEMRQLRENYEAEKAALAEACRE
jgi:ferritin-like metal-binding protein YciE